MDLAVLLEKCDLGLKNVHQKIGSFFVKQMKMIQKGEFQHQFEKTKSGCDHFASK